MISGVGTNVETVRQVQELPALPEEEWSKLRPVGELRISPISFARASANLTLDSERELQDLARRLKTFPRFYVRVIGHARAEGDPRRTGLWPPAVPKGRPLTSSARVYRRSVSAPRQHLRPLLAVRRKWCHLHWDSALIDEDQTANIENRTPDGRPGRALSRFDVRWSALSACARALSAVNGGYF
jgi:hypothetical protein